ncbi:methyl-accepting chemotaxis protein [Stappia sp. ES.058]|uniref:methyl-accepting chemotaxis protein n=1 Tax=Stappia sp. ES.058 TaxID=1881061 RepID=UPI00087BD4B5|nr:methyl-accepting chemotaxis protein [Stappia sp. ES.058]SDT88462.1 methyl-accepting chemotaxis protein [Stappia sp. ES.058]
MPRLLGIIGNLGFAAKIGGGFAVVLLLTAIVGGVGALTIGSLTDQMKTSEVAAEVMDGLQDASASREAFLRTRDPKTAAKTMELVAALDGKLQSLRTSVAEHPDAAREVDAALQSVSVLETDFATVGNEIENQKQLLAELTASVTKLGSLANMINAEMQGERRDAKREAVRMSATRRKVDEIGQVVTSVRESALRVQYLFLLSTTSTASNVMDDTLSEAAILVSNARALTNSSVDGIDQDVIETLATEAGGLETALATLKETSSFSEVHQLRRDIKDALASITKLTSNVQISARIAAAQVQKTAQASSIEQIKVDLVSGYGGELAEQSIKVKASTLGLISGLGQATADQVQSELGELSRVASMINSAASKFPEVAKLVEQIQAEISSYRAAFDSMLASMESVQAMTSELGVVANEMQEQVSGAAARQAREAAASGTASFWTITVTLAIVAGLGVLVAVVLSLAITRPTRRLNAIMGQLAEGDTDVEINGTERGDEIGAMSRTLEVFRDNARERARMRAEQEREQEAATERQTRVDTLIADFRTQVQELLTSVGDTASGMEATARDLTRIAGESAGRAEDTSHASGTATQNVESVATAAEELAASIAEISRQVGQTTQVVGEATEGTRRTNEKVAGLAEAANKIGEVVTLIQAIAEQTNLLALNATIEAARAGEAGKGFAVVAAEVKELATQTSKATEEIGAQIGAIQGSTREAVEAIEAITATMQEVDNYTSAIAAAVEQQGAATNEISRNVQNAATGTTSVSANMGELSNAVAETNASADMVLVASSDVGDKTRDLRGQIDRFLNDVAAA